MQAKHTRGRAAWCLSWCTHAHKANLDWDEATGLAHRTTTPAQDRLGCNAGLHAGNWVYASSCRPRELLLLLLLLLPRQGALEREAPESQAANGAGSCRWGVRTSGRQRGAGTGAEPGKKGGDEGGNGADWGGSVGEGWRVGGREQGPGVGLGVVLEQGWGQG